MFDFDYCMPLWDEKVLPCHLFSWPSVFLRDAALATVAHSAMAAAVTLRLTPQPTYLEIDVLVVGGGDRGRGVGTWTLQTLCALADLYGVDLRLTVSSIPTSGIVSMTDDELAAWYGRYGFVRDDDGEVKRMVRRRDHSHNGGGALLVSSQDPT